MRIAAPILIGFLALNALAVIATPGAMAFLQQDDQPAGRVPPAELTVKPAEQAEAPLPATYEGPSDIEVGPSNIEVAAKKDLEADLPNVPSLRTPPPQQGPNLPAVEPISPEVDVESLGSDPVFQEIKKMFQSSEVTQQSPPMLNSASQSANDLPVNQSFPPSLNEQLETPSEEFFERLKIRMETANGLCQAAQSLVHEAALAARAQKITESRELLGKATQLRAMAADLLTRRLP